MNPKFSPSLLCMDFLHAAEQIAVMNRRADILHVDLMDLRFVDAHFSAVVQGWYPGARGGKAIAELLFGKYSPSGKLPVTFYNSADDLPAFIGEKLTF